MIKYPKKFVHIIETNPRDPIARSGTSRAVYTQFAKLSKFVLLGAYTGIPGQEQRHSTTSALQSHLKSFSCFHDEELCFEICIISASM